MSYLCIVLAEIVVRFLPNLDCFGHIFINVPNIKFHLNPSSRSRAVTCEQTYRQKDEHGKSNGHVSRLCEGPSKCYHSPKYQAMKPTWTVDVVIQEFWTSAIICFHAPTVISQGKRSVCSRFNLSRTKL